MLYTLLQCCIVIVIQIKRTVVVVVTNSTLITYPLTYNDAHPLVFRFLYACKILLRRFVRTNKNAPHVDEVELMGANPCYAK